MGVPAFFRWLSRKYPSIVVKCDDGVKGQYHFDNLYLDMNGIIHPCSHPENKPAPANEEEMFLAIFEYIEDILKIVKPKKLLYMAVDGVAPRAKMNQQRSRRFRAAQESYEKIIEINKVKENLRKNDIEVPEKEEKAHFDSNVITPGTDFMMNLSDALRTWINRKLSEEYNDVHGIWPKDLLIILSDATVPGEGEHKIMDYIRRQKADKKFDPNLSHCLYGADADLIMLGLATHEPNFTILREEFKPNQAKCCDLCGQLGHELKDCTGQSKPIEELPVAADTEFIYIRLNVLREYLEKECQKETSVRLDFERFIDDYVFLCFFVGNDFLPHLPSLEIRENAIDRLIKIYKYVMEAFPDAQDCYLTKNGFVNKQRVQLILQELGEYEDEIFQQRQQNDLNYKERNKRRKLFQAEKDLKWTKPEAILKDEKPEVFHNAREEATKVRMAYHNNNDNNANARLNQMLINPNDSQQQPTQQENPNKRKRESDDSDSEPEDPVQLYNEGWKERYYLHKFGAKSFEKISKQVADEYFKGLCWVMLYYYQGCPDWKWFFPYHYACFASDFKNIEKIDVKFDSEAKPFRPLEQLMSVFPAASSQNLPPSWRALMTNNDSPIIDFYPTTFKIDLNGKKAAWMGVALLPFIDEDRLFSALQNVYGNLSENEIFRNRLGSALMFTSKTHPVLSEKINDVIQIKNDDTKDTNVEHTLLQESEHNLISGTIKKSILFSQAYAQTLCCEYNDPQYQKGFVYRPILLKNARIPPAVLKPQDLDRFQRYRPIIGMNPRNDRAYMDAPGHRIIERSVQKEYDRQQQPYHNQYGYQNFQHQYGQQYSSERYNYHHQNRNHNNNYPNDYHNNNRNSNMNQRNFQHSHQQPQQKYSNYNCNYSSNSNTSNLESNYSKSSYYQDAQRGPNYQQHYSSSSNNNNYNRYPSHYQQQQQQSSSQSNISSYYTSDYATSNNNQQQQQQPRYDNSSWYRSKSNNNYHHHHHHQQH